MREKSQFHPTQPSEHKKCLVYECGHDRCNDCNEKPLGYVVKEEKAASEEVDIVEGDAKEGEAKEGDAKEGHAKEGDAKEDVVKEEVESISKEADVAEGDVKDGVDGVEDKIEPWDMYKNINGIFHDRGRCCGWLGKGNGCLCGRNA